MYHVFLNLPIVFYGLVNQIHFSEKKIFFKKTFKKF